MTEQGLFLLVYRYESKRAEIESIIKEKKAFGIVSIIICVILSLLIILYDYFLINFISINIQIRIVALLFATYIFMIGYDFIITPVNPYDHAFFEIFEALRIIDMQGKSELLNEQARKRVFKAHERLYSTRVRRSNAPWFSISNEIEKIFKRNLITRVAPAIINGTIMPVHLNSIAKALIGKNILDLEYVNKILKKDLDEIVEEKPTIYSRISVIISNNESLRYIQENKLFRPISVYVAGFIVITITLFLYSLAIPRYTFEDLVSNSALFILGGLAASALINSLLSRVDIKR